MKKYNIWQRKNGLFEGKITIEGKQISRYGKSEIEVSKKLEKLEKEKDRGLVVEKKIRLEKALLNFLVLQKKPTVKPSYYDRLESTYKNQILGTSIGLKQLSAVTPSDITSHLLALSKTLSESSVKKVYVMLNEFFRYTVATRELNYNPMLLVKMPHSSLFVKRPKEMDVLTTSEMHRVIAEATRKNPNGTNFYRYGEAVVLLLLTGLRSGEIRALRMQDIDLSTKSLQVNLNICHYKDRDNGGGIRDALSSPKTEKSHRSIPLTDRALISIQCLKETTYCAANDLLIATDSGRILSNSYFERTYDQMLKRAGIKHMGLHSTRHTFATTILKDAEDKGQIKEVSELLGHSQVSTTYEYYIKTNNDDKRKLVQSLDTIAKVV